MDRRTLVFALPSLVLLVALGIVVFRYVALADAQAALQAAKADADAYVKELQAELADRENDISDLTDALTVERNKTGVFERQIRDISGTVGTLEKLAKTDPELLAKYSKVYFLNENYAPPALARVPDGFAYEPSRNLQVHAKMLPFLEDLLEEAAEDDIDLQVISAYRSFGTQAALKSSYIVTYGAGANSFSADQGYSEHQLGTTLDFTTATVGATFTGFDQTPAFDWLERNAWKYGFILSYPAGNGYYQYEPWHWRFVGEDLAERLHDDKKDFYDLDQRTIDEYLASLFD
ncbi:MAG TPA: D-alanyl-D-alanine carboxypeptidase family protein [Candidatus Paceibacterota bacterium]|nr:D-alanyl-D-alanine carboxypeptidase family protein [Candidatus Paceibacterota bacterium]